MTQSPARPDQTMPEPPPSLVFEMVADIAILQAIVAGLANTGDPATLAVIRGALAQLAVRSTRVGQHTPLVKLIDDIMQQRIAAFEARLPRLDRD